MKRLPTDIQLSNNASAPGSTQSRSDLHRFYNKYIQRLATIMQEVDVASLEKLADALLDARDRNAQIFIFGNGGSASTASHIANDFTKDRFGDERLLFRIICLNDNCSTMTATANDEGYSSVFETQLKNLLQPNDVVIAISSSGNSDNVVRAIQYANHKGANTFGIVGFDGGRLQEEALNCVYIPSKIGQYGYMEDVTLIFGHVLSIYIYEQDAREVSAREEAREMLTSITESIPVELLKP